MLSRLFKHDDAHEFKPILAEIEDEPVSPFARTTFWLTFLTVVFFIAWSIIGQVDVVVTAQGKVIPDSHAKVLQPLDSGVVSKILVKEGDFIHKGQPLMEIDPSMTADELHSNTKNYKYTKLEINRIESVLSNRGFNPDSSDPEAAAAQKQLYESAKNALDQQIASKTAELNKAKEEQKETQAELVKNKDLLDIAMTKRDRLTPVIDIIPRDDWDKNESDITTYTGNIKQAEHKLQELTHQQEQLQSDIAKVTFDFKTTNLQDLSQKQKDAAQLDGKVRELTFKHNKQTLVAPVDGYVDTLYVHTVGGVVSPAEKLMSSSRQTHHCSLMPRYPITTLASSRPGCQSK